MSKLTLILAVLTAVFGFVDLGSVLLLSVFRNFANGDSLSYGCILFALCAFYWLSRASTPLTGGGKCLLENVGRSKKKLKNWGIFFGGKLPRNAWRKM